MIDPTIRQVPLTRRIRERYLAVQHQLGYYAPPFVKNAKDEISKMIGINNVKFLLDRSDELTRMAVLERHAGNFDKADAIISSPYFGVSDCLVSPLLYQDIHTAVSIFMKLNHLKGKRVLQVAPNWGPYMYFLQQELGAIAFGIDKNQIAVRYAKEKGGMNFIVGDAGNLPFNGESFDLIFAKGFLNDSYLNLFFMDPSSFMDKVVQEIHRTLKPGGLFFFQVDYSAEFALLPTLKRFRSMRQMEAPSHFGQVNILQK